MNTQGSHKLVREKIQELFAVFSRTHFIQCLALQYTRKRHQRSVISETQ